MKLLAALLLGLLSLSLPASAHDLPASEHPATREVERIEELLGAQPPGAASNPKLFSFIASKLVWKQNRLAVCFWNGARSQRKSIADIADQVAALTPVRFVWGPAGYFSDCPAAGYQAFPVRVSLLADPSLLAAGDNARDYFAPVGQQALSSPRKASVNLPFPAGSPTALYREKTLHEFCHVLGCLHEHQRGLCDKDFNAMWIKDHYHYNDAQYTENFLNIPTSDAFYGPVQFGSFDDKSIMLYSIPVEAFSNPNSRCYRAQPVTDLSGDDRRGLGQAYGGGDPLLKTVDDFERLARFYQDEAQSKRAEARAFRQTAAPWAQVTPLLAAQDRSKALRVFETFARKADADAATAEQLSESYRLTPEATAKLRAFLDTLPQK